MLAKSHSGYVVERDHMVPMRDGTRLATDVYIPEALARGDARPAAAILERSPYGKTDISRSERCPETGRPLTRPEIAAYFASHGFVVVMQDCRGRGKSEGKFTKYVNEAEDGVDTLAWLQDQIWSNGRIGTMGVSYGAHTQLAMACLAPPGLACMFMDSGGFSNAFQGGIRRGGAFELKQATWAYRHALLSPDVNADPDRLAALRAASITEWFRRMPWQPGASPLSAAPEYESYVLKQWREGKFTEYWKRPGLWAEPFYDTLPDIPITIIGSWYDPYVQTCIQNYSELSSRKKGPIKLLMGPWTHGDRSETHAGDVDFGTAARFEENVASDYLSYRLDWFRTWLCDQPVEPLAVEPPVMYFEMGGDSGKVSEHRLHHGGRWRKTESWPPPQAIQRDFFFDASKRIVLDRPKSQDAFVDYAYDPRDPVPTIGGSVTSGEPVMRGGAFDQRIDDATFTFAPGTARIPLSARRDVLAFETGLLEEDLIITGDIEATLFVSSDQPDTDFTVKLLDVYPPSPDAPNGFAMNICDGIMRARFREGWDREVMMEPGRIYEIHVRLSATSNLFRRGHILRVDVSSSNFPQFDINPNTGGPLGTAAVPRVATNRIYCNAAHPSRIHLPVMPTGAPDKALAG